MILVAGNADYAPIVLADARPWLGGGSGQHRFGGSKGAERQIANVAACTAATDAVNVGQLNQVADWSRSYTDQCVNAMNRDIQNANNRASAGVASAMAMAGLPQATTPGHHMAAIAGGTFRGESSIAAGLSTVVSAKSSAPSRRC